MKRFEMLEHTADIMIRAYGKNLAEVFENACRAMTEYIFGKEIFHEVAEIYQKIRVESVDQESLLVDFLSEILFRSQIDYQAAVSLKFLKISERALEVKAGFCKARALDDIKAVTYHGLKIEKVKGGFLAEVVFDI